MNSVYENVLQKLINGTLILPSLPESITRILAALDNDDLSIDKIEAIVSQDKTVAMRLMKFVGSAYMGQGSKVISLKQALVRIGVTTCRSLVLAVGIEQVYSVDKRASRELRADWNLNMRVMSIALSIYAHSKFKPEINKDDVLLLALCHSIGMVPIILEMSQSGAQFTATDYDILHHSELRDISSHIVAAWNISPKFSRYITSLDGTATSHKHVTAAEFILAAYAVINHDREHILSLSNLLLDDMIIDDTAIIKYAHEISSQFGGPL